MGDCEEDWGEEGVFQNRMMAHASCWSSGQALWDLLWTCSTLNTRGPCKEGERLVYKRTRCPATKCRFYPEDPESGASATCTEPGRRMVPDHFGDYSCQCDARLGFLELGGSCQPRYLQGSCQPGQQVTRGGCREDTCASLNNATMAKDWVLGANNVCFILLKLVYDATKATRNLTAEEKALFEGDGRVVESSYKEIVLFSAGGSSDTFSNCKNVASLTGECLQRSGEQDPDRYDTDDIDDYILQLTLTYSSLTVTNIIEDVRKESRRLGESGQNSTDPIFSQRN
jgi:hypothetical protein